MKNGAKSRKCPIKSFKDTELGQIKFGWYRAQLFYVLRIQMK